MKYKALSTMSGTYEFSINISYEELVENMLTY